MKVDIQSNDAHEQTISSFANCIYTPYKKMIPDSWFDYSMEVQQLTRQFIARSTPRMDHHYQPPFQPNIHRPTYSADI